MSEEPPVDEGQEEEFETTPRSTAIAHKGDAAFERQICDSRKRDADFKSSEALSLWLRAHEHMNEAEKKTFHGYMDAGKDYRETGDQFYTDASQQDERADNYFNLAEEKHPSDEANTLFGRAATIYEICGNTFRHSGENYFTAFDYFEKARALCEEHDMDNIA